MADHGPLGWCYYCLNERDEKTPATVMVEGYGCCERDAKEVYEHDADKSAAIEAIREQAGSLRPYPRP